MINHKEDNHVLLYAGGSTYVMCARSRKLWGVSFRVCTIQFAEKVECMTKMCEAWWKMGVLCYSIPVYYSDSFITIIVKNILF